MASQYVMGIDIGTSGCKTLIINDRGGVVARATEEYPLSTPHPGWSEQDPERWWQAVRTTVQRVTHAFDMLTKKIIDAHKGSIEVKSGRGKGSEFIIRLPEVSNG